MEYKMKCNVCGKVFCYTDEDLKKNLGNAGMALVSSIGGLASVMGGGSIFHTSHFADQTNQHANKVVDYSRCPSCNSKDISFYSGDEETGSKEENQPTKIININTSASTEALLKRAFIFLEDKDWVSADAYCEACLDRDPELAEAYLGKMMAALHVSKQEELQNLNKPFDNDANYRKVVRYADDNLRDKICGYVDLINTRNEVNRKDGIWREANAKFQKDTIIDCKKAVELYKSIPGWKNADERVIECQKKLEELQEKARIKQNEETHRARIAREQAEKQAALLAEYKRRKIRKITIASIIALVMLVTAIVLISGYAKKNKIYQNAVLHINEEKYTAAMELLEDLGNFKDSKNRLDECVEILETRYNTAKVFMDGGNYADAILHFRMLNGYKDSALQIDACKYAEAISLKDTDPYAAAIAFNDIREYQDAYEQCMNAWSQIAVRNTIDAGYSHAVGLKTDGTVVATGDNRFGQCEVSDWKDIIAVSAGLNHTVGLKSDGTVVAVGRNDDDQCEVSDWENIVAISAGYYHTVGLMADGTVIATGKNSHGQCSVDDWTDIVGISARVEHTVGLKADGTVVAVGVNSYGECNVSDYTDIVDVTTSSGHTILLKNDGAILVAGDASFEQSDFANWTNIADITVMGYNAYGVNADGTVLAIGMNRSGQCSASDWTDIVAISAAVDWVIGLKSDGAAVAAGYNEAGQCNVQDWENLKVPD